MLLLLAPLPDIEMPNMCLGNQPLALYTSNGEQLLISDLPGVKVAPSHVGNVDRSGMFPGVADSSRSLSLSRRPI